MDNWYYRFYEDKFSELVKPGKVAAIYGPRRSGKTSSINRFLKNFKDKYYFGVEKAALNESPGNILIT